MSVETEVRLLSELIRRSAEPLPDIDDPTFAAAFDRFGDARIVLLGEASHGTSEFYRARAAISQRLMQQVGSWDRVATSVIDFFNERLGAGRLQ